MPADPVVLQLYELAVEMADRVSARRATANTYFLSVLAALTALAGVLESARTGSGSSTLPRVDDVTVLVTALTGALLSAAWWLLLRSYRDLNRAKFEVINDIEKHHLPIAPFADEWEYLKTDPVKWWKPRYAELGFVERVVPVVFLAVYSGLALRVLL